MDVTDDRRIRLSRTLSIAEVRDRTCSVVTCPYSNWPSLSLSFSSNAARQAENEEEERRLLMGLVP